MAKTEDIEEFKESSPLRKPEDESEGQGVIHIDYSKLPNMTLVPTVLDQDIESKLFHISIVNMIGSVIAPLMFIVDLGTDINTAVTFHRRGMMAEFGWTIAFILLPAFLSTAIYLKQYSQYPSYEDQDSEVNKKSKFRRILWLLLLVLQLAPLLRLINSLIYTIKWYRASCKKDHDGMMRNYIRKKAEDADGLINRVVECFLESTPQLVLQITLVLRQSGNIGVFQKVTICMSAASALPAMCVFVMALLPNVEHLRDAQYYWLATLLLTLGQYFILLSRAISIAIIACFYPNWTILACSIHILASAIYLLFSEHNRIRRLNIFIQIFFAILFGVTFLFTYILSIRHHMKTRYVLYYTLCLLQNITCVAIWYVYISNDLRNTFLYYLVPGLSIVPYFIGICLIVVYCTYIHRRIENIRQLFEGMHILDHGSDPVIQYLWPT